MPKYFFTGVLRINLSLHVKHFYMRIKLNKEDTKQSSPVESYSIEIVCVASGNYFHKKKHKN